MLTIQEMEIFLMNNNNNNKDQFHHCNAFQRFLLQEDQIVLEVINHIKTF